MKKDNLEKEILNLKKKGMMNLRISSKLNIPELVVYEICIKEIKRTEICGK